MLPVDRSFLHQRMPSGAIDKINIVYDEPFWRNDGLSGQSAAPGTAAPVTIDASTDAPRPGVMCVIAEGPIARQLRKLGEAERRRAVLTELVGRFGDKAASPVDYIEQCWTTERYSGGGMLSHAPPDVLTEFGPALREPCGRIHWAGTESSAVMCGWVDGAVRSGEIEIATPQTNEKNITANIPPPGELPSNAPTISCSGFSGMMSNNVRLSGLACLARFSASFSSPLYCSISASTNWSINLPHR